jgi:hypothetical protein
MKTFHEFVDKSTAPIQGKMYHVHLHGQEVYSAEITQYKKGACWATLTVLQPANQEMSAIYKKGDSFEVKVAQYIFTLIES